MKYGLLKYNTINIGDDIQSLAAKNFLPRVDYYIDRDFIGKFKENESTKIILNGWFMHKPTNWPPPNNIHPLFVSFHISPLVSTRYLYDLFPWLSIFSKDKNITSIASLQFVEYYKKFEPIGCRDNSTVELLKNIGVDAYYTGCLTLTLENRFKTRNNNIVFVDPFGPSNFYSSQLIKELSKKFPKDVRDNSRFLTHLISKRLNVEERFKKAQELLDIYAQAKLVVTSRLHCALPCLAFGTPVIFINTGIAEERFQGLEQLLKTISLQEIVEQKELPIDWESLPKNPVDITHIKKNLIACCEKFVSQN